MDSTLVYAALRTAHVGAAFVGLVVFWLPILARKGGRLHVLCGRIFVASAAAALTTALVMCVWRFVDPLGPLSPDAQPSADQSASLAGLLRLIFAFLAALASSTLVTVIVAVRAVRARRDSLALTGLGTRLLLGSQVVVGLALIAYASAVWFEKPGEILYALPVAAGVAVAAFAWRDLRYFARPRTDPTAWRADHAEFMLRGGIAYHTAFAVFVLTPRLGGLGSGALALLPWVLPSVLGFPVIWLWVRRQRRTRQPETALAVQESR